MAVCALNLTKELLNYYLKRSKICRAMSQRYLSFGTRGMHATYFDDKKRAHCALASETFFSILVRQLAGTFA